MASGQHFSFKYFPEKYFCKQNIFKIARPVLAALSVNRLTSSIRVNAYTYTSCLSCIIYLAS